MSDFHFIHIPKEEEEPQISDKKFDDFTSQFDHDDWLCYNDYDSYS